MMIFLIGVAIILLALSIWIVYEVHIQSKHYRDLADKMDQSDDDYIPVDKRKL